MIDGKQGDAFDENTHRADNERVGKRRYFSSTEGPFQSANNIYLFYGGADRALIVSSITHRIRKYPEPVIVTGESGSGKSMMSLVLSQKLQTNFNIIEFGHASCDPASLLKHLVIELTPELVTASNIDAGIDGHASAASALIEEHESDSILVALVDKLRQGTPGNKPVLLLIDAKVIDKAAYNMLLHLTQVINAHGRPFACVIFAEDSSLRFSTNAEGEAEGSPAEAPSADGLPVDSAHYRLRRLNLAETTEYLQHHMLLFDFNKRDLFTREMAYFIADRSKGNCSTINTLARNAFLLAHLEGADRVSMGHLLVAGHPQKDTTPETFFAQHKRGFKLLAAFALSSTLVAALIAAVLKFSG